MQPKKGRGGQTSSEQLYNILNWIELSSKIRNRRFLNVVKKQFHNSDDATADDDA
jgi:hypothetical protein